MRPCVVGIVLLTAVASLLGSPPPESIAHRVARLINQLGDEQFAKREAASRELAAVGEPARAALKTAASSSDDSEIRWRSNRILKAMEARACQRELAKWAGFWKSPEGVWMKISGDRWTSGTPTFGPCAGVMWISGFKEKVVLADFAVEDGPTKGQTCKAIFRLDGDALHYCGTYAGHYPSEFRTVGNYYSCVFRRMKE
jgi:uncharacterized protein (TIGR03067 family)